MKLGEGKEGVIFAHDMDEAEQKAVRHYVMESGYDIIWYFLMSMVRRLNELPASKAYGLYGTVWAQHQTSLRYDLIEEFKQHIDEFESTRQSEKYGKDFLNFNSNKITLQIKLSEKNGMKLLWINDGTGVYGPTGQEIHPVNKKYMFIPGPQYIKSYYTRKFQSQGHTKSDSVKMWRNEVKNYNTVDPFIKRIFRNQITKYPQIKTRADRSWKKVIFTKEN